MNIDKKTFCEYCNELVSFTEKRQYREVTLEDKVYAIEEQRAVCANCNHEIYQAEFAEANTQKLYGEAKKDFEIITLDKIKEIPQKYNISMKNLCKLLGWGETTYSRYANGYTPSKTYSNQLLQILENPDYFLSILDKDKDKIDIDAYNKSRNATCACINVDCKHTFIERISNYILKSCPEITGLGLQKALYFTQGFFTAFFNRYLFENDCEAWPLGPVYIDIYYNYRKYFSNQDVPRPSDENENFSESEKLIIDAVIKNFCCYSGDVLAKITHSELPWVAARNGIPADARSNTIITKESIEKYFMDIKEKANNPNPVCVIAEYAERSFCQLGR